MNIRDRGLRLAGYLTPPSDITQDDDDGHLAERLGPMYQLRTTGVSHLKVEKPTWTQLSAPVLIASTDIERHRDARKAGPALVTDEIRINVPTINKVK